MESSTQSDTAEGNAAPLEPLSDEEIVRRVRGGDAASFELLIRRYNQRLFRVVRSIVASRSETEDVMQEAYLRAYSHLGQFRGESQFSTWLTRIAIHEAVARQRGQRRLRLVVGSTTEKEEMTAPSAHTAEDPSLNELRHVLAEAVDELEPELRIVFVLRIVERLSTEETAMCLELTPANVKVRLHRARRALQLWIDRRIGEEARQLYLFNGDDCDRMVREVLERIARLPETT